MRFETATTSGTDPSLPVDWYSLWSLSHSSGTDFHLSGTFLHAWCPTGFARFHSVGSNSWPLCSIHVFTPCEFLPLLCVASSGVDYCFSRTYLINHYRYGSWSSWYWYKSPYLFSRNEPLLFSRNEPLLFSRNEPLLFSRNEQCFTDKNNE